MTAEEEEKEEEIIENSLDKKLAFFYVVDNSGPSGCAVVPKLIVSSTVL